MHFRTNELTRSVKIALYAGVAVSGLALGTAVAEEAVKLDKVEVTGSHIKRVDVEGPSPVLVIDREAIETTGAATVAEVLRKLPQNSGPSFDEKFTNSFAPGSAGLNMRGLGQDAVLVLLNGRRVAQYGFAQNINDAFVDLNSIPLGAVERIEILKDGASAIYGSDAIAGVVNIILRKDYEGAEVTGYYGSTDKGDGQETSINFMAGTSNATTNITFNIDYFNREAIDLKDRSFSKSADHTGQGGEDGYDFSSSTYPVANVRSVADGSWLAINGFFDFNPYITMIPETERLGTMINLDHEVTADVNFYAQGSWVQVQTDAEAAHTPLFGDLDGFVVPAGHPDNTYGEDVYTRWRMIEAGQRLNHLETDAYRLLAGLKGTAGNWDWDGAAIYSRSKTVNTGRNYVNAQALSDAIDSGDINPFGTSPNDPDAIDAIKATTSRTAVSELKGFDATATSEVWELPAGPVGLALGLEYRDESVTDTPDALSESGQIVGSGGTSSKGSRDSTSVYAELNIPVVETVEMQLALRYEDYSDFGDTTNPKIALRYQPNDWMMFRGSWGTGFRAPSLVELYLGESESYPFLVDTTRCEVTGADQDCGGSQYRTIFSGNPDLDPEESENWYLGAVFEPTENLTFGIDYWRYEHTDIIDANTQYILDNESAFPGAVVRSDPAFPGDPGEIMYINDAFQNISEQKTDGFDFDAKYTFDVDGAGEFTLQGVATYVNSFKRRAVSDLPLEELVGTYGYPEWRAQVELGWSFSDYSATLTGNYIDSYEQYYTDWNDEISYVDSMLTWDAQFVYTGIDSLKITLGIENMFDEEPPFSNSETEGYDFATHDPRGRFIYGRLNWQF